MNGRPQQLATIQQTADALSVSKNTVWRMIRDKSLTAYRVRNRWRLDLNSFLDSLKATKQ